MDISHRAVIVAYATGVIVGGLLVHAAHRYAETRSYWQRVGGGVFFADMAVAPKAVACKHSSTFLLVSPSETRCECRLEPYDGHSDPDGYRDAVEIHCPCEPSAPPP